MGRGAGGTQGGIGHFFIGVIMICTGGYMLLQSITIQTNFSFGMSIFRVPMMGPNYFNVTSGMIFIPFIFGIGLVFYNARNILGWILTIGPMAAMIFGVIANTRLQMKTMTAFELIVILVLFIGGIGLFLSSLRNFEKGGKELVE